MSRRVGMVGLGLMGQAFSANLLQAGFVVQGFDRDGRRMDELRGRGGVPADSPAAAARNVRWLLTSLPTSEVVREVALGPGGVAEGAEKGLLFADTSTARPEDSEALAAELAGRGIGFLDAAVSGTSTMAWKKDLVVIAGGEAADFDACRPLFEGFSRKAYHMGPAGAGARTKLVVNLVLAGNRLALAEGMIFGVKAGLDPERLLTVLQDGACGSKTMIAKGPKIIGADYAPESQIKTCLKDSRLMLEQGQRLGAPMLMTGLWSQLLQAAYHTGLAEKDSIAFYEVLREMAGLPRRG